MSHPNVIERFVAAVAAYPDSIALCTPDGQLSYRDLASLVEAIRQQLKQSGLPRRAPVGVLTGDDRFTYASILAILAAGSPYVPIHRSDPAERMASVVQQAGLTRILASEIPAPLEQAVAGAPEACQILSTAQTEPAVDPLQYESTAPEDLAYLFFTSGSTGVPKGVPIYHRNLTAFLEMVDQTYRFSPSDRFLQMFSLTFDLSVMCIFTPLSIGASCHVPPATGIAYMNIVELLEEDRITVALMVPSVLRFLEKYLDELAFPELETSLFCGEALSQALTEAWSTSVPNAVIHNVYGPTEATIFCLGYLWEAARSRGEAENGVVAIGTPLGETESLIVDEQLRPAPAGEKGELCLFGPQVTDQYWHNREKTEEAFATVETPAGPTRVYRTGDVAYVNGHGNYVFCGRVDHQVKIEGHRIELGEIEHHAAEVAGTSQVAAVAKPGRDGQLELHLYVAGAAIDSNALVEQLRARLPAYMTPRQVHGIDALPINRSGKVDRPALVRRS